MPYLSSNPAEGASADVPENSIFNKGTAQSSYNEAALASLTLPTHIEMEQAQGEADRGANEAASRGRSLPHGTHSNSQGLGSIDCKEPAANRSRSTVRALFSLSIRLCELLGYRVL